MLNFELQVVGSDYDVCTLSMVSGPAKRPILVRVWAFQVRVVIKLEAQKGL